MSWSGNRKFPSVRPSTVTVQEEGASSPTIMRMVVDLPLPLGPTKPLTWPASTVKLKSTTAST